MLRLSTLLVVAFFLTFAKSSAAHADGVFFQESVGSSTIGSDLGEFYDGSIFIRAALGAHVDNLSAEAFFAVNDLQARGTQLHQSSATLLRYGAEARYFIPTGNNLRLYMRGGLSSNHLTNSSLGAMEGRGIEYGTGAMYTTKVRALGFLFWPGFFTGIGPKVSVSLWTDLGGHYARLRDSQLGTLDVRSSTWSVGVTIGGGF